MLGAFGSHGRHQRHRKALGSALLAVALVAVAGLMGAPAIAFAGEVIPVGGEPQAHILEAAPTITSISSRKFSPGNPAPGWIISGTDLGDVTEVRSNGVAIAGSIWDIQSGAIHVNPPVAKAAGTDEVYTLYDGATESVGSESTTIHWVATPDITSISPDTGAKTGGTSVVITGTDFEFVDGVSFGSQAAASFTVDSNTQITATTAVDVAAEIDVTVSISNVEMGAGPDTVTSATSSATKFTFTDGPGITSLSPTSGTVDGGTSVEITGTAFTGVTGASGVTFDGTNATSYTVDSATKITAVAPAHAAGMVSVVVTSPDGPSNLDIEYTYVANAAPAMNAQPQNRTVDAGSNATFTATSQNGVPAPTIKWQTLNAGGSWVDISGATASPLTLSSVVAADNGKQVRAVFTNSVNSVESNAATLTVYTAPVVTTHPQSQTKNSGEQVTFTAAATTGNPTPTVKWQSKTGGGSWTDVSGETSLSYTFTTVAGDNGKQYRAVFTNTMVNQTPSVPTNAATLSVTAAPAVTTHPQTQTKNAGQSVTFTAAATGTPTPTVKWQSKTGAGSWTDVSGETSLSYTFTTAAGDEGKQYRAIFDNSIGSAATTNAATLTVQFGPAVTTDPQTQTKTSGAQVTFTAAATGNPAPTLKWQVKVGAGSWTDVSGETSLSYTFTTAAVDDGKQYRALFDNSIGAAVPTAAATLTVNVAPSVLTPPSTQTKTAGASVTFTAAATGNPTPTVRWQVRLVGGSTYDDIAGATQLSYTFTTAAGDNGKRYRAVFTNSVSFANTDPATLTVNSAPAVTTQPQSQTVTSGTPVTFTVAASGFPVPTVKWQVKVGAGSWTDIPDETGLSYTFTPAAGDHGNQYRAVLTNTVSSADSDPATLTINTTPAVEAGPQSQTKVAGESVTFTATASGRPTPTVQWQVKAAGGNWTDVAGATSTGYTFAAAAGDGGKQYRAVFTNSVATVNSDAATLSVTVVPTVTTQPQDQSVVTGQPVSFTAAAAGTPEPTVQWQSSTGGGAWTDLAGKTGATLPLTAALSLDGVKYRAVFTNSAGSVTSGAATLTVSAQPLPPDAPSGVGIVAGTSSITVTWQASKANGSPVTGYTATASPGPATCTTEGALSCVLGATAGTTYSVTVVANSTAGESAPSDASQQVAPEAPQPPAAPPQTDLQLTTDQGDISHAVPGQEITFIGTGFAPHSTAIITIYSDPIVLGTAVTDDDGNFTKLVAIPPGLQVGDHTAVAQGVAPDGSPRAMALDITVAVATDSPSSGGGGLPVTGPAIAMMLVIGLGLTMSGLLMVKAGHHRRRRA